MTLSPAELFLAGFHDADPGVTTRAFGGMPAWMAGTAPCCRCWQSANRAWRFTVEAIELRMRCGPAALWGRFGGMYDLGWLAATDRAEIERRFMEAVTPLCGADGRMDHSEQLRRITAVRGNDGDGDAQCR